LLLCLPFVNKGDHNLIVRIGKSEAEAIIWHSRYYIFEERHETSLKKAL